MVSGGAPRRSAPDRSVVYHRRFPGAERSLTTALSRLLGLVGASVIVVAGACRDGPASRHVAGILLVTVDTLRADHMDIYGYARDTMPNTEQFFSEGAVFEEQRAMFVELTDYHNRLVQAHRQGDGGKPVDRGGDIAQYPRRTPGPAERSARRPDR